MSNIEWKDIERSCNSNPPAASFGCIGGVLETDYARIDYRTVSRLGGRMYLPLGSLIDEYEQNIRCTTSRGNYNIREEDPDMSIAELLERLGMDPSDCFYRDIVRRDDGLELYVTFKDSEGRLDKFNYLWYNTGLLYAIDTESLTVSNWRDKVETGFKTTAEEFLNSLRDVKNEEEFSEKSEPYFHEWMK